MLYRREIENMEQAVPRGKPDTGCSDQQQAEIMACREVGDAKENINFPLLEVHLPKTSLSNPFWPTCSQVTVNFHV